MGGEETLTDLHPSKHGSHKYEGLEMTRAKDKQCWAGAKTGYSPSCTKY
jgi:hypothetical protein